MRYWAKRTPFALRPSSFLLVPLIPLRIARRRLFELELDEPNFCRQSTDEERVEVHHEVFAGGLDIQQNDLFKVVGQKAVFRVGRFFVQYQCVVKFRHDMTDRNLLDFTEIHYQSLLGMSGLIIDLSRNRYVQLVGMAMDVFARTIVAVEGMGHVEGENFGDADCHEG